MDYRPIHLAFSDRAQFDWSEQGNTVNVHLLADNEEAIVLTMPRQVLAQLGADIADELACKPSSNHHR
jgi:hypothetical protein